MIAQSRTNLSQHDTVLAPRAPKYALRTGQALVELKAHHHWNRERKGSTICSTRNSFDFIDVTKLEDIDPGPGSDKMD